MASIGIIELLLIPLIILFLVFGYGCLLIVLKNQTISLHTVGLRQVNLDFGYNFYRI